VSTPLRSLAALGALAAVLPVNAAVTGLALATGTVRRRPAAPATGRTVLVSGGKMTKALQLCRSFHAAGHRVVLVESAKYRLTGHRFSRAVDAFHVVPDVGDEHYAQALLDVVEREDVDVFVPVCSPAASLPDARAGELLAGRCEVMHLGVDEVQRLDDKHAFARTAQSLGLAVPDTHLVTDVEQVLGFDFTRRTRPYILKSIAYDPVHRLDLTRLPMADPAAMRAFVESLPISDDNPWILQEFVEGTEYCTHGTVRDGRLMVYLCCESSAFQINYEMVDKPDIRRWVETFVGALGLTGQVSFDFIEADDGIAYAIECNPRTHSAITMLRDHDGVAAAYLDRDATPVLRPARGSRPTYWLYHEVWRMLTRPSLSRLRTIARGTDAVFDARDPLPFLLVHHLQIPSLLVRSLLRGGSWVKVDFNIGKLVEPAGD
jgi:predicted ATP-grasp superfamily ATP-dependent carboligase